MAPNGAYTEGPKASHSSRLSAGCGHVRMSACPARGTVLFMRRLLVKVKGGEVMRAVVATLRSLLGVAVLAVAMALPCDAAPVPFDSALGVADRPEPQATTLDMASVRLTGQRQTLGAAASFTTTGTASVTGSLQLLFAGSQRSQLVAYLLLLSSLAGRASFFPLLVSSAL